MRLITREYGNFFLIGNFFLLVAKDSVIGTHTIGKFCLVDSHNYNNFLLFANTNLYGSCAIAIG